MGLTPHRAAKEASLRIRSGLSPAVMSSAAALSGPTPGRASSPGATRRTISGDVARRCRGSRRRGAASGGPGRAGARLVPIRRRPGRRRRLVSVDDRVDGRTPARWSSSSSSDAGCAAGCSAWVRALMALRAGDQQGAELHRLGRCGSSGSAVASPASTARAAASASTGSDLPRRRRATPVGPVDLEHLDPRARSGTGPAGSRSCRCPPRRPGRSARSRWPTPTDLAWWASSVPKLATPRRRPTWSRATATCEILVGVDAERHRSNAVVIGCPSGSGCRGCDRRPACGQDTQRAGQRPYRVTSGVPRSRRGTPSRGRQINASAPRRATRSSSQTPRRRPRPSCRRPSRALSQATRMTGQTHETTPLIADPELSVEAIWQACTGRGSLVGRVVGA